MARENLQVAFCIEIGRRMGDTPLDSEIVRRYRTRISGETWPWPNLPDIYYDPRSLSEDPLVRSSLHAKFVVVDRKGALITSPNFTEAAWLRNIELGVLVNYESLVSRITAYVSGLTERRLLLCCAI
jgi:phosphatidylserine/phosphatidylglycerophosphate/cardiolipin synthase-like enzyme